MSDVERLESEIRDFINAERKRAALIKRAATWGKVCSSLDAIGDTELAIQAYEARESTETRASTDGNLYISIYGILHALYLQQDAVKNLAGALGIAYERSEGETAARDVRNAATGHPTHQNHVSPNAFNFISRVTLHAGGFQMLTYRADGSSDTQHVNVAALIAGQREGVTQALHATLNALRADESEHRARFCKQKLAEMFPATLGYLTEKVDEAIRGGETRSFAASLLASFREAGEKFMAALAERGLDGAGFIAHNVATLQHAVARLTEHFTTTTSGLTEEDAHVFLFFIHAKLAELRSAAAEIDADYSTADGPEARTDEEQR
ncbi:MAG: hypothetical protein WBY94_30180 [Polyangiaceae bacterium]